MLPTLLQQTRQRFPDLDGSDIEVTPLEKGGSDRIFYRIATGGEKSLILVKYSGHKEENRHYVAVADFLTDHGIHAPQIYFHDPAEGLIWMEDLGEIDLWAFRAEPWEIRCPLYESTLTQAARLHALPVASADALTLQPSFDERLYLWEQNYFFENCLQRHFGWTPAAVTELAASPIFHEIAARLAALPRCLLHRDFQSQNIMIRDAEAWLIDFQGLRSGLGLYDAASLLYDPYVDLTAAEREALLDFYLKLTDAAPDAREIYHLCALQRLMQALGAYGFLGHVKERPHFLNHIPKALNSLLEIVTKITGLEPFAEVLVKIV